MIGRVAGGHWGRLVATRKTHGRVPRAESPLTALGLGCFPCGQVIQSSLSMYENYKDLFQNLIYYSDDVATVSNLRLVSRGLREPWTGQVIVHSRLRIDIGQLPKLEKKLGKLWNADCYI